MSIVSTRGVSIKKLITFIIGLLLILSSGGLFSAELRGTVYDAVTKKTIPMVNITIADLQTGTASDNDGNFILTGPFTDATMIAISHVGYTKVDMSFKELKNDPVIYLEPIPIILKGVEVKGEQKKYEKDVPTDVKVFDQKMILERAPTNLGELLRSEASVQIQSVTPGYQTVSIRGSNPNQVVVLYDGIPIKGSSDDIADISWIDINDIGEVQVIKGSQSVMHGSGGIGGVLNIESARSSPYLLSLSGRFGNFNTKDGYIAISKQLGNLDTKYSISVKNANYIDKNLWKDIATASAFHNFTSVYQISDESRLTLRGMVMDRFLSEIGTLNETDDQREIASVIYNGRIFGINEFAIQGLYRRYYTKYINYIPNMAFQPQARFESTKIRDEMSGYKIEKNSSRENLDISAGFEYFKSRFNARRLLDFIMESGYDSIRDSRNFDQVNQAFYSIFRYHTETGLKLLPYMDWSWSLRYDHSDTKQFFDAGAWAYEDSISGSGNYKALNYTLGLEAGGEGKETKHSLFFTNGSNIRFPSLYDLFLNNITISPMFKDSLIRPERVISYEIGGNFERQSKRFGVFFNKIAMKITMFHNVYTGKIYYKPFVASLPVTLNWLPEVPIDGYDFNFRLWIFADRLDLNLSALWLNIENKMLFPNKPDTKYQAELSYIYRSVSMQVCGFYESEQTGFARIPGGAAFFEELNARLDMNLFFNYRHSFPKLDMWLGVAAINLFSNENSSLVYSYFNRVRMVQVNFGFGLK